MTGLFVPESLTPLAFTPLYAELSEEDRLAYNHLHGRYFLEQTIFFEQLMGRPALHVLANSAPTEDLRKEARDFANEEDAHSSWFRALLREVAPGEYDASDFVLLSAPWLLQTLTKWASRSIRWFPGLLWLQLMAEERALYFGRIFLAHEAVMDPRFIQVQRKHLADEPSHIRRDEAFLNWIWPASPAWLRRLNARLIRWVIYEFLYLPKRSGWRVVEHWLATRPHLVGRTAEFRTAMNELSRNPAFLAALYPRKFLPRTDHLARRWPELAFFDSLLTDSPTIL
jgi:hypothetical protein